MFPNGLFPPSLFTPGLFPRSGGVPAVLVLPGSRYWAPRYFAGVYFAPTYWGPQPPGFVPDSAGGGLGGYWSHSFWAAGYWAPTYWCPWQCPFDLLGAIHDRIDNTPALRQLLDARHWTDAGDDSPDLPYLVIDEVSSVAVNRNTSVDWTEDRQLQANFFAATPDEARAFLDVWEETFHPTMNPMCIAGGYVKGCMLTGDHLAPAEFVGPKGSGKVLPRVRQLVIEFTAMVGRHGP